MNLFCQLCGLPKREFADNNLQAVFCGCRTWVPFTLPPEQEPNPLGPLYAAGIEAGAQSLQAELTAANQRIAELEGVIEIAIDLSKEGSPLTALVELERMITAKGAERREKLNRLAELEAEKAGLEADARRYRWLRDTPPRSGELTDIFNKPYWTVAVEQYGKGQVMRKEKLDVAIDAQLAAEKGKGVEG